MKILIFDSNEHFITDIESRMMLNDDPSLDLVCKKDINKVSAAIEKEKPDKIVIAAYLLSSYPDWNFDIPVCSYAKHIEDIELADEAGIPCYGITRTALDLINAIKNDKKIVVKHNNLAPARPQDGRSSNPDKPKKPRNHGKISEKESISKQNDDVLNVRNPLDDDPFIEDEPIVQKPKKHKNTDILGDDTSFPSPPQQKTDPSPLTEKNEKSNVRERLLKKREEEEKKRREAERLRRDEEANRQIDLDTGKIKEPAKVIASYSAKGGVGKTTIACELATYLALTAHGRSTFRVCLVDYNIDFGDVINTLPFDPKKPTMSNWAADIRERMAAGASPEDITYTSLEMDRYLQKDEQSGLYALLAPITHEDSMYISDKELCVMIDNLKDNGDFDFIVCDTGNNTRDSSFIALERADIVLLVLTQNINAANCNDAALTTMENIDFDMNKFTIVINQEKPANNVGVSSEELKEVLKNPNTGKAYPCITVIKDSDTVRNSSNTAEPLVFNSDASFTKSIGKIAKYVIGDDFVLEEPKKKGLFAKLFGKRKK